MTASKKIANVRILGIGEGQTLVRRPFTGTGVGFDREVHFMEHEVSNFVEAMLPEGHTWIDVIVTDPAKCMDVIRDGYDLDGVHYFAFSGGWGTQHGRILLASPKVTLSDLGLTVSLKNDSQALKAFKAMKRAFAPCRKLVLGVDVTPEDADWPKDEGIYQVADEHGNLSDLRGRFVSLDSLNPEQKGHIDGNHIVGPEFGKKTGLGDTSKLGWLKQGHFMTRHGLGKGHIQSCPWLEDYDFVVFGPKAYFSFKEFGFAILDDLKETLLYTDAQSMLNFDLWKNGLAPAAAEKWFEYVSKILVSKDERALVKLLLTHMPNPAADSDEADLIDLDQAPSQWIAQECVKHGLSHWRFPGLLRKVARYLAHNVVNLERGRIPLLMPDGHMLGTAKDIMCDPYVIDAHGDINPDLSVIPVGQIAVPGLEPGTKIAVYRNPNGHPGEMAILTVFDDRSNRYRRFRNKGVCFGGRHVEAVHALLNGGDADDRWNLIVDKKWVDVMSNLPEYPVQEKEDLDAQEEDYSSPQGLNTRHVELQIQHAALSLGPGPVVNRLMLDWALSHPDHKESLFEDLLSRGDNFNADWLTNREDCQGAFDASNLDHIIDGKLLPDANFSKIHDKTQVYPWFYANARPRRRADGSTRTTRIPDKKAVQGDYVIADTLMCKALKAMTLKRIAFEQDIVKLEWLTATPASPDILEGFPVNREVALLVNGRHSKGEVITPGLFDTWREFWAERHLAGDDQSVQAAYQKIEKIITEELDGFDHDTRMDISVEIYRQTYQRTGKIPVIREGEKTIRSYPDGLFFTKPVIMAFIRACQILELTARRFFVTIDNVYRKDVGGDVNVSVRNGLVYRMADDACLGIVIGVKDANYVMEDKIITMRRAHEALLPVEVEDF